jgi:hypothetical protein
MFSQFIHHFLFETVTPDATPQPWVEQVSKRIPEYVDAINDASNRSTRRLIKLLPLEFRKPSAEHRCDAFFNVFGETNAR